MNQGLECLDRYFQAGIDQLRPAIERLRSRPAVSLPLLDDSARAGLCQAARRLPYRPAQPVIGKGEARVYQDFEVCTEFPKDSVFHDLARSLERLLCAALAELDPALIGPDFHFNDLIAQRYAPGARGISPHRDHLRYQGLVAILTLAGQARFLLCNDRAGTDPQVVPIPAGSLLLLRAPGFAGRQDRPYHALEAVTQERLSLGLRYDTSTTREQA